jgi:hypothetical protein
MRIVESDATSRFTIRLSIGTYVVTPLPGQRALPGRRVTVQIQPGRTTWAAVRYVSRIRPV